MDYDWPGNIRQLEAALETVAKMQAGPEISEEDLGTQIFSQTSSWEGPSETVCSHGPSAPFGLESKLIYRNSRTPAPGL